MLQLFQGNAAPNQLLHNELLEPEVLVTWINFCKNVKTEVIFIFKNAEI